MPPAVGQLTSFKMAAHALVHVVPVPVQSFDRFLRSEDVLVVVAASQITFEKIHEPVGQWDGAIVAILGHKIPIVKNVQQSVAQVEPVDSRFRNLFPPQTGIKTTEERKFEFTVAACCI